MLALAAALRLAWLGVLPAPAGDEGAWAEHALRVWRGEGYAPPPGSRYATALYPALLAPAIGAFGKSFFGLRLLGALAGVAGVGVVWAMARRLGATALGALLAAAFLAVHPTHVAWSRTAAVPYALQTTVAMLGAHWLALSDERARWRHAGGLVLLATTLHMGPIHAATALACAVWLARGGRWRRLLSPPAIAGLVAAAAIAVPVLWADVAVVGTSYETRGAGPLRGALLYARGVAFAAGGVWTVNHFSPFHLPLLVGVMVGACVVMGAARSPFAALAVSCHLLVLPALLALKGLDFTLSSIDADRYFVALVPWLALGATRDLPGRRWMAVAPVAACVLLLPPFFANLRLGGKDRGYALASGGGYRGWRVAAGGAPLVVQIARDLPPGARAVVVGDHALESPLRFLLRDRGVRVLRAGRGGRAVRDACLAAFDSRVMGGAFTRSAEARENARLWRPGAREYTDRGGHPLAWLYCGR